MSDPCRAWRSLMTRQAESRISSKEASRLEAHLRVCRSCRDNRDAADALAAALRATPVLSADDRQFDDRIIMTLRRPVSNRPIDRFVAQLRSLSSVVSFNFCIQFAGGALIAASVTGYLLVTALRSSSSINPLSSVSVRAERPAPPTPMEWLLDSPAPRAAMLWGTPAAIPKRIVATSVSPVDRTPKTADPYGTARARNSAGGKTLPSGLLPVRSK